MSRRQCLSICLTDATALQYIGFLRVEPGPYFYLPLIGSTTLRDLAGNSIDLLVVPTAVGAPFDRTAYAVPTTVVRQLNDRIEGDAQIQRLQQESLDPYVETRTLYLELRKREIDALKVRAQRPQWRGWTSNRNHGQPDRALVRSRRSHLRRAP